MRMISGRSWWGKKQQKISTAQSDAQMIVSADAGGYMAAEKKEKGKKKDRMERIT